MERELDRIDLFRGLGSGEVTRFADIARTRSLDAGEYLFQLGDSADHLYVVLEGTLEICFPLTLDGAVKDVALESRQRGSLCGWSALVRPHRFTLSARAAAPSRVAAFPREALQEVLDASPRTAHRLMERVTEVLGNRLLHMRALWAREVQRAIASGPWGEAEPTTEPAEAET